MIFAMHHDGGWLNYASHLSWNVSRAYAFTTHISHEGYLEHDELDMYAASHGFRVAFDGLSLAFDR